MTQDRTNTTLFGWDPSDDLPHVPLSTSITEDNVGEVRTSLEEMREYLQKQSSSLQYILSLFNTQAKIGFTSFTDGTNTLLSKSGSVLTLASGGDATVTLDTATGVMTFSATDTVSLGSMTGSLDDITNGTTYSRVLTTAISAGSIKLTSVVQDDGTSTTIDINALSGRINIDGLFQDTSGGTYNLVNRTSIFAGKIILTSGNGVTGSLPVANTDADVTQSVLNNTTITSGRIELSTTTGDLDDIIDGTTHAKVDKLDLTSNRITISSSSISDVAAITADEATGGGRAFTNITAGNIYLGSVDPGQNATTAAGLHIGQDKIGYHDGTRWTTVIGSDSYITLDDGTDSMQFRPSSGIDLVSVAPSADSIGFTYQVYSTNNSRGPRLIMQKSDKDTEGLLATDDGDHLGAIEFYGVDSGNSAFHRAAKIEVRQRGAAGGSAVPGELFIQTSTDSGTNYEWRFKEDGTVTVPGDLTILADDLIVSSGKASITQAGTASGHIRLHASDTNQCFIRFFDSGTGTTDSDGGIVGFNTPNILLYNYENGSIFFGANGNQAARLYPTLELELQESLFIKEKAGALVDKPAYGQLWIKSTTPCQLWFTDDDGTDTQIV